MSRTNIWMGAVAFALLSAASMAGAEDVVPWLRFDPDLGRDRARCAFSDGTPRFADPETGRCGFELVLVAWRVDLLVTDVRAVPQPGGAEDASTTTRAASTLTAAELRVEALALGRVVPSPLPEVSFEVLELEEAPAERKDVATGPWVVLRSATGASGAARSPEVATDQTARR